MEGGIDDPVMHCKCTGAESIERTARHKMLKLHALVLGEGSERSYLQLQDTAYPHADDH